jgi:uncharacterized membrane protein
MNETQPTLYCANHPNRETTLRCNRCDKPICTECAVHTPTGYRCKQCVQGQQRVFNTAVWYDYALAFIITGLLSFIGSRIVPALGFFTIFLAPIAGVVIAEIVRFLIRRRRSKSLFQVTAIAAALGSLPSLLFILLPTIALLSRGSLGFLWALLWQGLYTFTVTSTVYYRLSGINIGR